MLAVDDAQGKALQNWLAWPCPSTPASAVALCTARRAQRGPTSAGLTRLVKAGTNDPAAIRGKRDLHSSTRASLKREFETVLERRMQLCMRGASLQGRRRLLGLPG